MIQQLKYHSRLLSAFCLYQSGLLDRYAGIRLRNKAVVLMYHRVLDRDQIDRSYSHPGICVTTDTFEKQMLFLREHFHILSLKEFLEYLYNRQPFNDKSCLITFDDGWRDNWQNAIPILGKYRIPAVIFLTTAFIGSNHWFWQERLACILDQFKTDTSALQSAIHTACSRSGLESISLAHPFSEDAVHFKLVDFLKKYPREKIYHFISSLASHVDDANQDTATGRVFMNWEEIRSASDLIHFGSHGVNHAILTVDSDCADEEIAKSKATIEANIDQDVVAFSYPNGNFSQETIELVKKNGYQAAFSTVPGYNSQSSDPYTLYRLNIHEEISSSDALLLFRLMAP